MWEPASNPMCEGLTQHLQFARVQPQGVYLCLGGLGAVWQEHWEWPAWWKGGCTICTPMSVQHRPALAQCACEWHVYQVHPVGGLPCCVHGCRQRWCAVSSC